MKKDWTTDRSAATRDWTDDVRDRLKDHRMAAPEGLLDDVKARMAPLSRPLPQGEEPYRAYPAGQGARRARIVRLGALLAAAAMFLGGVLLVGRYLRSDEVAEQLAAARQAGGTGTPGDAATAPASGNLSTPGDVATVPAKGLADGQTTAPAMGPAGGRTTVLSMGPAGEQTTVLSMGPAVEQTTVMANAEKRSPEGTAPITAHLGEQGGTSLPIAQRRGGEAHPSGQGRGSHSGRGRGFFFGTTAGAAGVSTSGQGMMLAMADAMGSGVPKGFEGKEVGDQTLGDAGRHTHYNRPRKVGVSVGYRLSDHVSLYSGITYSYLSSKTTYDYAPTVSEKQRLHYVGIPLGVSYTLYQKGRFRAYASAGGEVQKLVSGRLTVKDPAGNMTGRSSHGGRTTTGDATMGTTATVTTTVKEDRPQFSVGAAVGAELRLVPHVNAYVEPAVVHYIDNGSNVRNSYKDKKTQAGISVGLRLGF